MYFKILAAIFTGMQDGEAYSGIPLLCEIDSNLERYSKYIFSKVSQPFLSSGRDAESVLDFGAGLGTIAKLWRENIDVSPSCIEIDVNLCMVLKDFGFEVFSNFSEIHKKFDYVYSVNVLEHIENEKPVIENLKSIMTDGALFCIYVPAFPILFSELDRQVGHFRRYTKKDITSILNSSGFEVIRIEYCDSLGHLSTLLLKLLRFSFDSGKKKSKILMNIFDFFVLPVSIFFDRIGFKHLFGKNIFAIAKLR